MDRQSWKVYFWANGLKKIGKAALELTMQTAFVGSQTTLTAWPLKGYFYYLRVDFRINGHD
jgi:hypothetical protein